jgi:hypothetical protein
LTKNGKNIQPKPRHGPLQAGHGWIIEVIAQFNPLNRIKHPWVARLKRAMTERGELF